MAPYASPEYADDDEEAQAMRYAVQETAPPSTSKNGSSGTESSGTSSSSSGAASSSAASSSAASSSAASKSTKSSKSIKNSKSSSSSSSSSSDSSDGSRASGDDVSQADIINVNFPTRAAASRISSTRSGSSKQISKMSHVASELIAEEGIRKSTSQMSGSRAPFTLNEKASPSNASSAKKKNKNRLSSSLSSSSSSEEVDKQETKPKDYDLILDATSSSSEGNFHKPSRATFSLSPSQSVLQQQQKKMKSSRSSKSSSSSSEGSNKGKLDVIDDYNKGLSSSSSSSDDDTSTAESSEISMTSMELADIAANAKRQHNQSMQKRSMLPDILGKGGDNGGKKSTTSSSSSSSSSDDQEKDTFDEAAATSRAVVVAATAVGGGMVAAAGLASKRSTSGRMKNKKDGGEASATPADQEYIEVSLSAGDSDSSKGKNNAASEAATNGTATLQKTETFQHQTNDCSMFDGFQNISARGGAYFGGGGGIAEAVEEEDSTYEKEGESASAMSRQVSNTSSRSMMFGLSPSKQGSMQQQNSNNIPGVDGNPEELRNDMTNVMKLALLAQYNDLCEKYSPEEARKIFLTILQFKQSQYKTAIEQQETIGDETGIEVDTDPYRLVLLLIDDVTVSLHKEVNGTNGEEEDEDNVDNGNTMRDLLSSKEGKERSYPDECETNKIIFDKYQSTIRSEGGESGSVATSKSLKRAAIRREFSKSLSKTDSDAKDLDVGSGGQYYDDEDDYDDYIKTNSKEVDMQIDRLVDLIAEGAVLMIGGEASLERNRGRPATSVAGDHARAICGRCSEVTGDAMEALAASLEDGGKDGSSCTPVTWIKNGLVAPIASILCYTMDVFGNPCGINAKDTNHNDDDDDDGSVEGKNKNLGRSVSESVYTEDEFDERDDVEALRKRRSSIKPTSILRNKQTSGLTKTNSKSGSVGSLQQQQSHHSFNSMPNGSYHTGLKRVNHSNSNMSKSVTSKNKFGGPLIRRTGMRGHKKKIDFADDASKSSKVSALSMKSMRSVRSAWKGGKRRFTGGMRKVKGGGKRKGPQDMIITSE